MNPLNLNDQRAVRAFAAEVVAALGPIAEKYGLTVASWGGRLDTGVFTQKVEWTQKVMANGLHPDEARFRADAYLYGLAADDFGRTFLGRGPRGERAPYRIAGIAPTRSKNNIKAIGPDGKTYVFPSTAVVMALRTQAKNEDTNGTGGAR